MKELLKIMFFLALFFAATFVMIKNSGVIDAESINILFGSLQEHTTIVIAMAVIAILFADLFIAVPTLTVCLLAGY
ncbi:MAG: TVP38/TMEM64 family protein, partial [Pseudomonadota bacterium]